MARDGMLAGVSCLKIANALLIQYSDPGPVPYFRGELLRSFSSLPLNHSRRVVVSYKRKYVHEVLVNCLFKLVQEKVWLG